MKKCLLVIGFVLLSCTNKLHDNPISALPLDHNTINMKIGDSWLYRQTYINIVDSGSFDFPETLITYSYFSASKDTTIDSMSYLIIDGHNYEIDRDSVYIRYISTSSSPLLIQ
jgi:hypothetical protein